MFCRSLRFLIRCIYDYFRDLKFFLEKSRGALKSLWNILSYQHSIETSQKHLDCEGSCVTFLIGWSPLLLCLLWFQKPNVIRNTINTLDFLHINEPWDKAFLLHHGFSFVFKLPFFQKTCQPFHKYVGF